MKFQKEINGEIMEVEEDNTNIFNLLERNGFKPVEEKVKELPNKNTK